MQLFLDTANMTIGEAASWGDFQHDQSEPDSEGEA